MGIKGTHVHVFVDRVSAVSVPHRLDGSMRSASPDISSETTAGNDLAQAIDVGIEWKRRSNLPNVSGSLLGGSQSMRTWRYRSSKTKGKPSKEIDGMSEITSDMGVPGNEDIRVSNSGNA